MSASSSAPPHAPSTSSDDAASAIRYERFILTSVEGPSSTPDRRRVQLWMSRRSTDILLRFGANCDSDYAVFPSSLSSDVRTSRLQCAACTAAAAYARRPSEVPTGMLLAP